MNNGSNTKGSNLGGPYFDGPSIGGTRITIGQHGHGCMQLPLKRPLESQRTKCLIVIKANESKSTTSWLLAKKHVKDYN
jgi:hypothetical protein